MSWGADRERGKVREGHTCRDHVPLLSASKTSSFFEASLPFFRSKLPWFLLGIDVHGIGVSGGSIPGGCYNPFFSSFYSTLHSFPPLTYLERKTPFLHKYFLPFDSYFFFLLFP